MIGKTVHEIWPADLADRYREDDRQVVRRRQLVDIDEEPSTLPGGETIVLHTKKVPLRGSHGVEPDLIVCISEDITERKKLEAELRAAIDVRDEFLSVASHELKTPLTALSLQIQLLHGYLEGREGSWQKETALVGKALRSCRQLSELLDELLDITRIRTGKLTLARSEVDLTLAVESLVATLSEEVRRSGSTVHVTAEGPVIGRWDPIRIHQVIWQSGLQRAQVRRRKAHRHHGPPKRQDRPPRGEGPGPGDRAEVQPRIFQRFERGVSGETVSGLGLGLYIVRQVLDAHGGSIHVESAPGKGTRFVVELPIEAVSVAPREGASTHGVRP